VFVKRFGHRQEIEDLIETRPPEGHRVEPGRVIIDAVAVFVPLGGEAVCLTVTAAPAPAQLFRLGAAPLLSAAWLTVRFG
jgi:hypothetical protein